MTLVSVLGRVIGNNFVFHGRLGFNIVVCGFGRCMGHSYASIRNLDPLGARISHILRSILYLEESLSISRWQLKATLRDF